MSCKTLFCNFSCTKQHKISPNHLVQFFHLSFYQAIIRTKRLSSFHTWIYILWLYLANSLRRVIPHSICYVENMMVMITHIIWRRFMLEFLISASFCNNVWQYFQYNTKFRFRKLKNTFIYIVIHLHRHLYTFSG